MGLSDMQVFRYMEHFAYLRLSCSDVATVAVVGRRWNRMALPEM